MRRLSGLQCEVLGLYRDFIRIIKKKQMGQAGLKLVRDSFRSKLHYPVRDVQAIENWLRTGKTKLQTLQDSDTSISFVQLPKAKSTQS